MLLFYSILLCLKLLFLLFQTFHDFFRTKLSYLSILDRSAVCCRQWDLPTKWLFAVPPRNPRAACNMCSWADMEAADVPTRLSSGSTHQCPGSRFCECLSVSQLIWCMSCGQVPFYYQLVCDLISIYVRWWQALSWNGGYTAVKNGREAGQLW